jgi:radical SAM superfamily enzyme YgiQ (UPF0313 family)
MNARDSVLIGQAYSLRFDPKLWRARQPYPPLGALYAAAAARTAGFDVAFFDAMLSASEDDWTAALDAHRPRVAVLFEDNFNYLTKMCLLRMREAALRMIAACRQRQVPVLVAGSDATDHPDLYLQGGAAAVIIGEGEVTLVEALHAMGPTPPDGLAEVPGLALPGRDGAPARTKPRPIIRDLDRLPQPAWDLVDMERYRQVWLRHHGYFSMNVATTRGCPYHCNWCAKPIYGQRYTAREPEAVADEIASLRARFGPDHLWIADDIFGLKPGWIERFADLQVSRGNVVPFKCLLRADGVTEPIARALASAGCRTAWIGAESGSQRILDAMEKGTRVEQIEEATRRLRARGIEVGFFLQFGYPGEDRDDIEQTIAMVDRCRPDDIGISVSYPLPGTPFYERVRRQMGATQNWVDSEDLAMMYRATFVPDFYRALHGVVHARVRVHRAIERLLGRPRGGALGRRPVRDLLGGALAAARLPVLRRRLGRLAVSPNRECWTPVPPLLSRRSAAIPTEQPQ